MEPTLVNPSSLAPPRGYNHGVLFPPGRLLFVAGQIGWDAHGRIVSDDIAEQFEQALRNVLDVVRAAGGGPEHVGRMVAYVTDRARYLERATDIGVRWRALMGKRYPAMALVEVAALLEPRALVELEAMAVLP
ncbi:MAG: RidA family protein [Myxococcales bacterium]|nr:RidA family protein [Myxococcales bacterium]